MTFNISMGMAKAMLNRGAVATKLKVATTLSFGDGDGTDGRDTLNDSASGLGGYSVTDFMTIAESTSNNGVFEILSVSASKLEFAAGSFSTEAAGDSVILATARGGSFRDLMKFSTIHVFSGTQPTTADLAESGAILVKITDDAGAFTPGVETNGLIWGTITNNIISPIADQKWSGEGIANGTAVWWRGYDNSVTTGDTTTAIRMDGACGNTGTKELNMSNLTIKVGGTSTVDTAQITLPQ